MRFLAATTASILFSLLALEAAGAPAPQYDGTIVVSTTVEVTAAGSAMPSSSLIDSASISTQAAASASTKACKAKTGKPEWNQAWRQHRRPRPSASGGAASTGQEEQVPSAGSDTPPVASSDAPIPSMSEGEAGPSPSPTDIPMPSAVETVEPTTATAIQAGADGEVQQPPPSEVAQPSVVETSSSYEYSSSSEWSTTVESSSAQASASAPAQGGGDGGGGGAPAGFAADILNAHNAFRATYGAQPLVWDQGLADQGTNYFKDKNCELKHSTLGNGENLTSSPAASLKLTGQSVLEGWAGEEAKWLAGKGFTLETGHFTQVVWKNTTRLGCAVIDCGGPQLAFCEYQSPGNVLGDGFDAQVVKS